METEFKPYMHAYQIDRLHNGKNFEKFRHKIHYHSIKEHLKVGKIAKFGCEMLQYVKNVTL